MRRSGSRFVAGLEGRNNIQKPAFLSPIYHIRQLKIINYLIINVENLQL